MTELKTLKDFGASNDFKNTDIYSDLRVEAVKWIKHYRSVDVDMPENSISAIGFARHFFNITKGELNDA